MIRRKLKVWALTIIGVPLLLLIPWAKRSMDKLDTQIENEPESVPEHLRNYHYFTKLDEKACQALKDGNLAKASQLAGELLELANGYRDDWNYGNAIHHANTILGLVAVKEGKLKEAVTHLQESADMPGSPQLDSCGPSTCLAMELLLKDKDDEVIKYLKSVDSFWDAGYKLIPEWVEDIRSGEIPEKWQRFI